MFAYSVKKHLGSFCFALAGADAIILTAGVGENCSLMRRKIFEGLEPIGIVLDQERNKNVSRDGISLISHDKSRVKVLVVPTNEELMIAWDVRDLVEEL